MLKLKLHKCDQTIEKTHGMHKTTIAIKDKFDDMIITSLIQTKKILFDAKRCNPIDIKMIFPHGMAARQVIKRASRARFATTEKRLQTSV